MELRGLSNFAAISRINEDIELDSDGEASCFNMPISSSSKNEDAEDGEEADSQTYEAHEGQTDNQMAVLEDNQMAVLEDIRILFSKNQEMAINTVKLSYCNLNFICNRDNSTIQTPFCYPPYYP